MAELNWACFAGRVLAALFLLTGCAAVSAAQEDPCARQENEPGAATPERIKQRAQTIRELKILLADADATVRLSALDTMLNSCDVAAREVAYEAGFASGDQALRALTLKRKILSAGQLLVEIIAPEPATKGQSILVKRGIKRVVTIGETNPATGTFGVPRRVAGAVNGLELQVVMGAEILRARLEEGAVMTGTLTHDESSVPVRIVLR